MAKQRLSIALGRDQYGQSTNLYPIKINYLNPQINPKSHPNPTHNSTTIPIQIINRLRKTKKALNFRFKKKNTQESINNPIQQEPNSIKFTTIIRATWTILKIEPNQRRRGFTRAREVIEFVLEFGVGWDRLREGLAMWDFYNRNVIFGWTCT